MSCQRHRRVRSLSAELSVGTAIRLAVAVAEPADHEDKGIGCARGPAMSVIGRTSDDDFGGKLPIRREQLVHSG
jgi:hypothetical protein